MSTAPTETTADRLPPTDVRFSLRGMLLLTCCVAVAAALYGTLLRQLPDSARWPASLAMVVIAVTVAACLAYVARARHRVERLAGAPRFVLPHYSYLFPRAPRLAATLLGFTSLAFGLGTLALVPIILWDEKLRPSSMSLAWNGMYALMAVAFGISTLWWNRDARLCQDGVLVRSRLVPWSKNRRRYWGACHRDVVVLEWETSPRTSPRTALRVPIVDHDAVATFIAVRITGTTV